MSRNIFADINAHAPRESSSSWDWNRILEGGWLIGLIGWFSVAPGLTVSSMVSKREPASKETDLE